MSISLLIIYLIGIFPNLYSHHQHEAEGHSLTACEVSIYTKSSNSYCNHKTHIYKTFEQCKICSEMTHIPLYTILNFCCVHSVLFDYTFQKDSRCHSYFNVLVTNSNKGPPFSVLV